MNTNPEISIVIPVFNEASVIEKTTEITINTLKKISDSFEIIIAEDGSTDGTENILENISNKYDYVKYIHSDKRLGRGKSLNRAFKLSRGEIVGFIDSDLATDMKHLKELIQYVRDGNDFVTGSRMISGSRVERTNERKFASKSFNFIVRLILNSSIYDHQCGFKAFRRKSLLAIMDSVKDTHWFWDTELLVRAQRSGYRIKEFPVEWKHSGKTKVNILKDSIYMFYKILKLRFEFI